MSYDFKSLVEQDLDEAFHNTEEFAEMADVLYNGKSYYIPIVMDKEVMEDRKRPSSDHAEGIFLVDAVAYIAYKHIGTMPRKGRRIEIDEEMFEIVSVDNENGEIVLGLEMLDE